MDVNMSSLAIGGVTAFLFGILLWGMRFILGWFALLVFGKRFFGTKCGKAFQQIGICLYTILFTLAVVVFLYYINKGVFRWFLICAIVLAVCVLQFLVPKKTKAIFYNFATWVRNIAIRIICFILKPLVQILKVLGRLCLYICRKMFLHIHGKYAKIKIKKYDKRKHHTIVSTVKREMRILSGEKKKQ